MRQPVDGAEGGIREREVLPPGRRPPWQPADFLSASERRGKISCCEGRDSSGGAVPAGEHVATRPMAVRRRTRDAETQASGAGADAVRQVEVVERRKRTPSPTPAKRAQPPRRSSPPRLAHVGGREGVPVTGTRSHASTPARLVTGHRSQALQSIPAPAGCESEEVHQDPGPHGRGRPWSGISTTPRPQPTATRRRSPSRPAGAHHFVCVLSDWRRIFRYGRLHFARAVAAVETTGN